VVAGLAGPLERAIMEVLWAAAGPLRVREMLDGLSSVGPKPPAYTTVQTVADRLAHKGLLTRVPDGNAFRYAPARSRNAYVTEIMIDALSQSPDHGAVLASFARTMDADDALRLLRELESRARDAGDGS
jgi:predicted transcriptional regulator